MKLVDVSNLLFACGLAHSASLNLATRQHLEELAEIYKSTYCPLGKFQVRVISFNRWYRLDSNKRTTLSGSLRCRTSRSRSKENNNLNYVRYRGIVLLIAHKNRPKCAGMILRYQRDPATFFAMFDEEIYENHNELFSPRDEFRAYCG